VLNRRSMSDVIEMTVLPAIPPQGGGFFTSLTRDLTDVNSGFFDTRAGCGVARGHSEYTRTGASHDRGVRLFGVSLSPGKDRRGGIVLNGPATPAQVGSFRMFPDHTRE
jgi:hypothetical protein